MCCSEQNFATQQIFTQQDSRMSKMFVGEGGGGGTFEGDQILVIMSLAQPVPAQSTSRPAR